MANLTPPVNSAVIGAIADASHKQGHNIFEMGQHVLKRGAERKKASDTAKMHAANKAKADMNQAHGQAIKVNNALNNAAKKAAAAKTAQAKGAARAQTQGVKKGTTAPGAGAPPRTFAMPAGPQGQAAKAHAAASAQAVKTMQAQRNSAHGQAIQMQNQMNRQAQQTQSQHARVMQQQINTAHGQALQMQAQKDKAAQAPFKAAAKGKAVPLSVQPRSGAFPQHQQPEGASTHPLPTLSANETAKTGRPNTFSTGSKKPSGAKTNVAGLAAMGSKLEEGLATKRLTLPQPRKRV